MCISVTTSLLNENSSPQICGNIHPNPQSAWIYLPQSKLEHGTILVGGMQGESRLLLQGGESQQKKCRLMWFLRQREMPAGTDLKGGLDWTHPSGRKSGTCMVFSPLRQLWELLDKAAYIVPVSDKSQSWSNYSLSSSSKSWLSLTLTFRVTQPVKPLTILTTAIIIIIIVHMMMIMMMMTMMMMIFPPTHRVTHSWLYPPIMRMVSPASGIPHAYSPEWCRSKLAPPVKRD